MAISPVDTTLRSIDAGVNTAAQIAATIPGVGPIVAGVLQLGETIVNAIGIRSGADEADVITKLQTPLGNQLIAINDAIPSANLQQLQTMFQVVEQLGLEFRQFVAQPVFTDGRASTQALNTIMPLIDGTGGYTAKNSAPGCVHCGPLGPAGSDGTLGSINYQIMQIGGQPLAMPVPGVIGGTVTSSIMAPPTVTQNYGASYYTTLQSAMPSDGLATIQASGLPLYGSLPSSLASAQSAPAVVSEGLFNAGALPLVAGAVLLYLYIRR